ncbi:unnamed protein product [Aphis gossypii]|uniref:Uncharacterized protein n=1 Tax=Aphis gossypii TaxID=80765 RepID=A0A9P0JHX3_APHGO|nr:unnamed protein product [Aphis gossypii]
MQSKTLSCNYHHKHAKRCRPKQYVYFLIIIILFYFTIYVFVLQYVSAFIKCDNIILFYQPLTICAIRYYTDKVNVCCVLFFLYAFFFVYGYFNIIFMCCLLFILAYILYTKNKSNRIKTFDATLYYYQ